MATRLDLTYLTWPPGELLEEEDDDEGGHAPNASAEERAADKFSPRDLLFGIEPFGFDRFLELVRRAPDGAALLFDALALRLDPRRVISGERRGDVLRRTRAV